MFAAKRLGKASLAKQISQNYIVEPKVANDTE